MERLKSISGEVYIGLIVGIILVSILLIIFPLAPMAKRNDDTTQMYLQDELNSFVSATAQKGGFTQEELENLQERLDATNNSYDIEIVISVADVNPGKKTDNTKIGDTTYYDKYNTQILTELEENGVVILKEGDIIKVSAKNVNTTLFQMIIEALSGVTGNEAYTQAAQASAICTVNGVKGNI